MSRNISTLSDPKSVALIGADKDQSTYGNWHSAQAIVGTTACFAASGAPGKKMQDRIVNRAKDACVMLLDPNCPGFSDSTTSLAPTSNPEGITFDEITGAMDASVQGSQVELLKEIQVSRELALLFTTHNIAEVRNIAQRTAILQEKYVVGSGTVEEIFANPQHSNTPSPMAATPSFELTESLKNSGEAVA